MMRRAAWRKLHDERHCVFASCTVMYGTCEQNCQIDHRPQEIRDGFDKVTSCIHYPLSRLERFKLSGIELYGKTLYFFVLPLLPTSNVTDVISDPEHLIDQIVYRERRKLHATLCDLTFGKGRKRTRSLDDDDD